MYVLTSERYIYNDPRGRLRIVMLEDFERVGRRSTIWKAKKTLYFKDGTERTEKLGVGDCDKFVMRRLERMIKEEVYMGKVAVGQLQYSVRRAVASGEGYRWSHRELDKAIEGPVCRYFYDSDEQDKLSQHISEETDFDTSKIKKIISRKGSVRSWMVGEALASVYLTEIHNCLFPWSRGRDQRRDQSSLPGSDLVGFHEFNSCTFFAFGEIKTTESADCKNVWYRQKTGLKYKIEELIESSDVRDRLVAYLTWRAQGKPWKKAHISATKRYLLCNTDVKVFGFIIKDNNPVEKDISCGVKKFGELAHEPMEVKILALYIPRGSLAKLPEKVKQAKEAQNERR